MTKGKKSNSNMKDLALVGAASLVIGVLGTLGVGSFTDKDAKGEEVKEGVVAVLDGKDITSKELYDEMVALYGTDALESLVSDRLANIEADKKKIKVPEEDVEKEVKTIKDEYPSEEDFKKVLAETGQTEEALREDVTSYLKLVTLLSDLIDTSDEALKKEFEANKETYAQQEQVDADHILVEDEKLAEDLYRKLSEGANFTELAKEHSIDFNQEAENGANLGYFGRDEMDEVFEEKVFGMKVGEISSPFKTQHGWHIAKVNDKVEPKEAIFEDAKEQIKKKLIDGGIANAYKEWILEMKDKYGFENKLGSK